MLERNEPVDKKFLARLADVSYVASSRAIMGNSGVITLSSLIGLLSQTKEVKPQDIGVHEAEYAMPKK